VYSEIESLIFFQSFSFIRRLLPREPPSFFTGVLPGIIRVKKPYHVSNKENTYEIDLFRPWTEMQAFLYTLIESKPHQRMSYRLGGPQWAAYFFY
jgi:hypothetical protein